ncbi:MAG: response regulator, partial [Pseudomonadota bacterium]
MVIRHEQRDVLDLSAATPVLFFEDNPADAHIVQLALEETPNQRFSIDIVDTFAKGIESLQRERYELVMLDLNLPDASGLESMRRLRAASELPVVVISGEADEQLAIDAVKAGAQDFVLKGQFHPELLGRLLTYAIERHAMEQQRLEAERERRRLMARLEDSQRFESLALLAGGVAHDFNNLLVSILGNADLAIREMAPNASGRDYLERIVHGAQRAADLSRQMLAYSGKGRIVVRPHDLTNLVKDTTEITKSSIAPEATLRFRLAKGLPPVEADATQLRQVILNLIINASEALQERPGTIVVSTGAMHCDRSYLEDTALKEPLAEGEYVFLEVADSGVGMTPATLAR